MRFGISYNNTNALNVFNCSIHEHDACVHVYLCDIVQYVITGIYYRPTRIIKGLRKTLHAMYMYVYISSMQIYCQIM
jgi:hypothetical protein